MSPRNAVARTLRPTEGQRADLSHCASKDLPHTWLPEAGQARACTNTRVTFSNPKAVKALAHLSSTTFVGYSTEQMYNCKREKPKLLLKLQHPFLGTTAARKGLLTIQDK